MCFLHAVRVKGWREGRVNGLGKSLHERFDMDMKVWRLKQSRKRNWFWNNMKNEMCKIVHIPDCSFQLIYWDFPDLFNEINLKLKLPKSKHLNDI